MEAAYQRKRRKVRKDGQHFLKEMKRVRFMSNQQTSNHFSIQSTWKCITNVLHSLLVCLCSVYELCLAAELPWFRCILNFLGKFIVKTVHMCTGYIISQAFQSFTVCNVISFMALPCCVLKCKLLPCLCSWERPHWVCSCRARKVPLLPRYLHYQQQTPSTSLSDLLPLLIFMDPQVYCICTQANCFIVLTLTT